MLRRTKLFIAISSSLVGVAGVFSTVLYAAVQNTPFQIGKLEQTTVPTIVYDAAGKRYLQIQPTGASDLPSKDIPKNVQNALVATEDHSFWQNSSFDLRGVLRSAAADVSSGSLAQGGSTIEEQLAKIVYLNDKKTFSRKIKQVLLGIKIERNFTKQQILTMYFNDVFFGNHATGIEEAAQRYFNIDLRHNPSALTLDDAALLAGLPQAPSQYDPILHPKAALQRRNQVLQNMVKYGYLTSQAAQKAEQAPLGVKDYPSPGDPWSQHPLFSNVLMDQLQKDGVSEASIMQGGLKIYTTVVPKVQSAIHTVFWNKNYHGDFPGPSTGTVVQGAAVFVNPRTGGIEGAAGSRKQGFARLGLDRIYANSHPGSSIKPIMEYAPAIESGKWTPTSILDDKPHDFGGGYTPQNWNANAPAKITLQYGLQWSQNVASVWLLQQIGLGTGASFAEKDGITLSQHDKEHLGIAIGDINANGGVNTVEMAQAYEPFANNGQQMNVHLITKVVNQSGQILYQYTPQAKTIMKPSTATTMTRLMQDVVDYGTGQAAKVSGWGVAGKTGTVQYDASLTGSHPNWVSRGWFDGYTPNLVGSIYIGYDQSTPAHHLTMSPQDPSGNSAALFGDIVKLATQGQKPQSFSKGPFPAWQGTANAGYELANPVKSAQATYDLINNQVVLNWQSSVPGTVKYQISRQTTGQTSQVLGTTANLSFTDPSVQLGQSYTYQIQALDPATNQPVGQPTSVTVTAGILLSSPGNNNTVSQPSSTSTGSGKTNLNPFQGGFGFGKKQHQKRRGVGSQGQTG